MAEEDFSSGRAPQRRESDSADAESRADEKVVSEALDAIASEDVDIEDLEEETALALFQAEVRSHSGPLPSPQKLQRYKEISPQAVDWIFQSATKEQEHRHWCEKEPLRQSRRAQNIANLLALFVVAIGGGLIYYEKPVQGFAAILATLATLLGVFVYKEVQASKVSNSAEKPRQPEPEGKAD